MEQNPFKIKLGFNPPICFYCNAHPFSASRTHINHHKNDPMNGGILRNRDDLFATCSWWAGTTTVQPFPPFSDIICAIPADDDLYLFNARRFFRASGKTLSVYLLLNYRTLHSLWLRICLQLICDFSRPSEWQFVRFVLCRETIWIVVWNHHHIPRAQCSTRCIRTAIIRSTISVCRMPWFSFFASTVHGNLFVGGSLWFASMNSRIDNDLYYCLNPCLVSLYFLLWSSSDFAGEILFSKDLL